MLADLLTRKNSLILHILYILSLSLLGLLLGKKTLGGIQASYSHFYHKEKEREKSRKKEGRKNAIFRGRQPAE